MIFASSSIQWRGRKLSPKSSSCSQQRSSRVVFERSGKVESAMVLLGAEMPNKMQGPSVTLCFPDFLKNSRTPSGKLLCEDVSIRQFLGARLGAGTLSSRARTLRTFHQLTDSCL